jgi:hypothetical protein
MEPIMSTKGSAQESGNGPAIESSAQPQLHPAGPPVSRGQNGGKSTGPRSEHGKLTSSCNSVKHGVFSKAVLVKGESLAEYGRLLTGLREYFQPVGAFEDLLVEKIATIIWRLRRMLSAESAEIQKAQESDGPFGSPEGFELATRDLRRAGSGVPGTTALDRLLRYEAALNHELDRTVSQFDRLQRIRRGQPVSPKLEVHHSLSRA